MPVKQMAELASSCSRCAMIIYFFVRVILNQCLPRINTRTQDVTHILVLTKKDH